jgi:hypothetical protein
VHELLIFYVFYLRAVDMGGWCQVIRSLGKSLIIPATDNTKPTIIKLVVVGPPKILTTFYNLKPHQIIP